MSTVILANGEFPQHALPLAALDNADLLIACDGAAESLIASGREPDWIVGDLDSLDAALREKYASRMIHEAEQETNDLSKAFRFACSKIAADEELIILGATGKREDHTLGNISLLADFAWHHPNIRMLTDTGIFLAARSGQEISCRPGQAISIFNPCGTPVRATAQGLKYPLKDLELNIWWRATLNTALADRFSLTFAPAELPLLLFLAY